MVSFLEFRETWELIFHIWQKVTIIGLIKVWWFGNFWHGNEKGLLFAAEDLLIGVHFRFATG